MTARKPRKIKTRRPATPPRPGGGVLSWVLMLLIGVAVVFGVRWWRGQQAGDELPPEEEVQAIPAEVGAATPQAAPTPPAGAGSTLALVTDAPGARGADAPLVPGGERGVLRQVLDSGVLPALTQGTYTPAMVDHVAEVAGTVTYRGMLHDEVVVPTVDATVCPEHPSGLLQVEDGRLANALIWLEGVETGNRIVSTGSFQLQQCDLQPKVAYFGVETVARITNADDVIHDVVAADAAGAELFHVTLAPGEERRPVSLSRPGLFRLRCERHPWEEATLLVLPHPYAATTTSRGTFHLGAVPIPASGAVLLRVFHPALGTFEQALQLSPAHPMNLEIDLTENVR